MALRNNSPGTRRHADDWRLGAAYRGLEVPDDQTSWSRVSQQEWHELMRDVVQ